MNQSSHSSSQRDQRPRPDEKPKKPYQPPRVEKVLTSDDLEREILYAGEVGLS